MQSVTYELPADLLSRMSIARLIEAEDAVARLDERARRSPLTRAWQQRLLYGEACATQLAEGELVHVSDLVLFDHLAWDGGPRNDLVRAHQTLQAWRKALRANATKLLASDDTDQITASEDDDRASLEPFWDEGWQADQRLTAWQRAVAAARQLPALLAAAIAWDAWHVLQPDQRGPWRAMLGAALVLKSFKKTRSCLLPVNTGWRFAPYRRMTAHSVTTRLNGFLEWSIEAAQQGNKELDRMTLADESLQLKLRGRRSSSKLPELVELLYRTPLISAPAAAKTLRCSQQAVDGMFRQLGSAVRETTGRTRYRMWTLA